MARALYDRLEVNALPPNRDYRYDFFWDNCSTRLLDAIDGALADVGQPRTVLPDMAEPQTFRQLLAPYLVGHPLTETGLNLALGSPGDRLATAREETFLPIRLADQLDRATVGGRPLVASRDTLFWVPGAAPASAGAALAAVAGVGRRGAGHRGDRRRLAARPDEVGEGWRRGAVRGRRRRRRDRAAAVDGDDARRDGAELEPCCGPGRRTWGWPSPSPAATAS